MTTPENVRRTTKVAKVIIGRFILGFQFELDNVMLYVIKQYNRIMYVSISI